MYTITKEFAFEAAHRLEGLAPDHQCSKVHGHSYRVEVELVSLRLDQHGMVVDYNELSGFADWLKKEFDHKYLNEVVLLVDVNPTAENLAEFFFRHAVTLWPQVAAVRVRETAKTCAEYRRIVTTAQAFDMLDQWNLDRNTDR